VKVTASRLAWLAVTVAVALASSGCTTTVSGTGTRPPAAPSSTSSTGPTAVPDFTQIKYQIPSGFLEKTGYAPLTPLEKTRTSHYFIPDNAPAGRDVLSVTLYTLPGQHLVDTAARQLARIKDYNRKTEAKLYSKIMPTTVGGLGAYNMVASEPGGYTYSTWFVFGARRLLQISCQWDKQTKKITSGCAALLKSVVIA
jgi:hypothetical protein